MAMNESRDWEFVAEDTTQWSSPPRLGWDLSTPAFQPTEPDIFNNQRDSLFRLTSFPMGTPHSIPKELVESVHCPVPTQAPSPFATVPQPSTVSTDAQSYSIPVKDQPTAESLFFNLASLDEWLRDPQKVPNKTQ